MAVEAKYTAPLQVVETPEMRTRIKAISDRERISQAAVARSLHELAIDEREQQSREKFPERWQ
jgi:hypothetical protein